MRTSRRRVLGLFASAGLAVSTRAFGESGGEAGPRLSLAEIPVADRGFGDRFVLLSPTGLPAATPSRLVVLLHGLGETSALQLGLRAWVDRYGLLTAYERLGRPPLSRTSKRGEWTDERLSEVNKSLASCPFRGFAIACPFTPAVGKRPDRAKALDDYAAWITEHVVPRAREATPIEPGEKSVAIDGCSLGGYVGLEVFLRKPEAFGALGAVQAAFGEHRAAGYAERLAEAMTQHGSKPIHLLTSTGDPFRAAMAALAKGLTARQVPHRLRVLPGPHDQPWLREAGTAEMLLFHDRRDRVATSG